jgi:integrase
MRAKTTRTKRAKGDGFPLTVRAGSSTVKIYRDRKESGEYFRVVYHLGGKRHRLNFHELEAAKTEALAKAAQLARGDVDAVQLTGRDRLAYGRALDAVKEFEIPLDAAAIEYAQARKVLNGHSLIDAARFFMRHYSGSLQGKPLADAVAAFLETKLAEGRSGLYLADLRYRLGEFAGTFHVEVRQLVPDDVRDFMAELKLGPRSFNNHLRSLRTFFKFCQARGWLSREAELLEGIGKRKEALTDIEIFTSAELRKLLYTAPAKLAVCISLQAFAGVRSEELLRLVWSDLQRRKGFVEISAGKSKTAARRLIPLLPNLAKWLAGAPRLNDRVWPHSKPYLFEALSETADRAGVGWKSNALRHSFISYRLAALQDVARVALEAGNSPAMVFRHYRELTTESEAIEWFSIVPASGENDNVVRLA